METPQWGVEPVPERLRVLGTLDTFLLWTNLGISILVLVSAAYLGLSLKQALLATLVGGLIGNTMLGVAALIGADARVPAMVLQRAPLGQRGSYLATVAQRPAVPRLGDVRADHHRDRRVGARRPRLRLRGAVVLEAPLRRRRDRPRAARADRLRAPVRAQVRDLGGGRRRSATSRGGSLRTADLHGLWSSSGGQGGSFFAGMDLIIALSVSWIPLVADYTRFSTGRRAAFWGAGLGYLFPTLFQFGFGAILVLSHPSISGPGRHPHDDRRRRRRELPRAARADRRRDGRGVRERLLDRGVAAELRPELPAARADRRLRRRLDGRRARRSTSRSTRSSSTCSARSSSRCSACCSPTGSSAACATRARTCSAGRRFGRR